MPYERPPKPGTYYIKSVAVPKNVLEVPDYNQERTVCSPQTAEHTSNQQWYIQRSGKGYKIKNVKYGVYIALHSNQPKHGTVVGAGPNHGPVDWSLMRTHDGFSIEYGDEDMSITLHYGLDKHGSPLLLWDTAPQDPTKRWRFERISDDVGGEVAETVEDRIVVLNDQLRRKDAEIVAKDQLLAQKERELRGALQSPLEVPPRALVTQAQMAELRDKVDDLKRLVESCGNQSEQRKNAN